MSFPTVSCSNLLRQKRILPQDFQGKINLVFIAFKQWHQIEVDSWIPLAKELEQQYEDLAYYELPIIQSMNSFYKMFINEGMRAGIPNSKIRERTITLYLNKNDFRTALGMPDEDHIYILLIDRQGKEFFRSRGPNNHDAEASLCQALLQLTSIQKA
jgi:hypothetical protein